MAKSKKKVLIATPPALYSLAVNWNNADGPYGYQQANADFKNCIFYDSHSSALEDSTLRVTLAKGVVGTAGGTLARFNVPDGEAYEVSYSLKFDPSFYFGAGGKLGFGFLLGEGYTGGLTGSVGGSVRLMWEANTLKPYVYHPAQMSTWGDDFGKRFQVSPGVWYRVRIEVTSRYLLIQVNGVTLLEKLMQFNAPVKLLSFENFRGGQESYWQSPQDDKIYFDDIVVRQLG